MKRVCTSVCAIPRATRTEDLDLFAGPGDTLDEGAKQLGEAAAVCGCEFTELRRYPDFRRVLASRGKERCVVDLVIDRAPVLEPLKAAFGSIRIDSLREIAADKICALLGRSEPKDLVDLELLLHSGETLEGAVADALSKEAGVETARLAWVIAQLDLSEEAALPPGRTPHSYKPFVTSW